jgi:hypothetical protein
MFVRILTLKGVSVEAAAGCLFRLLEARGCVVTRNDTGDELECFGLIKSSWLIQCSSEMTLVQVDDTVELRIKLHTMISVVGGMLGVLSLVASILTYGIPWLLFALLYVQAGRGVIHELDVIVDEIYKRIDVSSKRGS